MNEDVQRPLEEGDYDELGEILAGRAGDDGLLLDAVHGLLTAVAIGPETVPPDEWMPLIADEGHPFESIEQAERMIALTLRLYNTITGDLDALTYQPILGQIETEEGEPTLTARGWCEGFSMGVDLREAVWEKRMHDDTRLMELLTPMIQLAADEGLFETEDGEEPTPLSEVEYEQQLNKLPNAVLDVQQYWRDHPPGSPVPERDIPAARKTVPRRRGGRWVH
jgi:uncharacterized protein